MNRICLLILLLLLSARHSYAQAPDWNWVKMPDERGMYLKTDGRSIAYDGQAFVYVLLGLEGILPIGQDTLKAWEGGGMLLAKYHKTGKLVWIRNYGGSDPASRRGLVSGIDLKMDPEGKLVVYGYNAEATNIDGHPLSREGRFLARFDTGGACLWARTIASRNNWDGFNMDIGRDGTIWVCGDGGRMLVGKDSIGTAGYACMFVAGFKLDGSPLWARAISGSRWQVAYGVAAHPQGGAYITGFYNDLLFVGADTLQSKKPAERQAQIVIARFDEAGELMWVRDNLLGSGAFGFRILSDTSGNAIVQGEYDDTLEVRGTAELITGASVFMASYAPDGSLRWLRNMPYTGSYLNMSRDAQNRIYICGTMGAIGIFGQDTLKSPNNLSRIAGFVAGYSADGMPLWGRRGGNDISGIAAVSEHEIYVTGNADSMHAFDPSGLPVTRFSNFFVSRLGFDPAVEIPAPKPSLLIFPNPGTGKTTFRMPELQDASLQIYNNLGQLVSAYKITDGLHEFTADLGNLPPGIYHVLLQAKGFSAGQKLIIRH